MQRWCVEGPVTFQNSRLIQSVSSNPAKAMKLGDLGTLKIGAQANFVTFGAKSFSELFSRAQVDRVRLNQTVI